MFNETINILKEIGYPFLFVWSILEGEVGLILAGWLSFNKVFELDKVLIIAITGAMIGDLILFVIGNIYKDRVKEWLLLKGYNQEKIFDMIKKYGFLLLIFERFVYGTHIPLLLVFGIIGYDYKKWFVFDLIGVFLWAIIFVNIGYFFGSEIIDTILFLQKQILIIFIVFGLYFFLRKRK